MVSYTTLLLDTFQEFLCKVAILGLSMWRMATAFPCMNVKGSTKEAKQIAYMTLVYHNLVYMIVYRLVTVKESMMTKEFIAKLAVAKTEAQLDALVDEIIRLQFPKPIQSGWKIPKLEEMEPEIIHLTTDWNTRRVNCLQARTCK